MINNAIQDIKDAVSKYLDNVSFPATVINGHIIRENIQEQYVCFYVIDGNKLSSAEMTMLDDGLWEFNRLKVHDDQRKLGIGTALVHRIVQYCKDNKLTLVNNIQPYRGDNNLNFIQLRNFYIKHGFKTTKYRRMLVLPYGMADYQQFLNNFTSQMENF